MQLTFYGLQDLYLTGNPQITFFKTVYRRYTYFSMESIRVDFDGSIADKYLSVNSGTELRCKIPRHGDLINEIYFVCTLPAIYSWADYMSPFGEAPSFYVATDFTWIKKIGFTMIESVSFSIDDHLIDTQYGEWLSIWHEIYDTDKHLCDKLIGHVDEIYRPHLAGNMGSAQYWGHMEWSYAHIYPTIESHKLYVPLNFWFNRSPGLALPLIALQYSDIYINFKLRKVLDLYTIHPLIPSEDIPEGEGDYTPRTHTSKPRDGIVSENIGMFLTPHTSVIAADEVNVLDIQPYLEVNYIFLSQAERTKIANVEHEYIIETTGRTVASNNYNNTNIELDLNHPVKELFWVAKRNDLEELNDWTNYTNWIHEDITPWSTTTTTYPAGEDDNKSHPVHRELGFTIGQTVNGRFSGVSLGPSTKMDYSCRVDAYNTFRIGTRTNGENFFPTADDIYSHGTATEQVLSDYSYTSPTYATTWPTNYQNHTYLENLRQDIITKCKIMFNGIDRIELKDAEYFKYVQRYQHYRTEKGFPSGKEGIYVYSFSLNGQELQPSGSCNMSNIGRTHMYFEVNPPPKKLNGDYYYGYNFYIYSTNYNILHIVGGKAGLKYSN